MILNRYSSLQNPQVRKWRSLLDAKGRAEQRHFLAEGDHLAGEALSAGAARILLVDEKEQERYSAHMRRAEMEGIDCALLSDHVMCALSDAKTPQGILAVCPLPDVRRPVPQGLYRLAALNALQDPGNVGTMLRTLDAAGFDGLLVDMRTADPYGPKALRASMGAVFRIPVFAGDLVRMLTGIASTHDLYAGALDGTSYFDRTREKPGVCVIIGNEGAGISPQIYAVPGVKKVTLPMAGGAESLNASVAGAIMIYDIVRRGE